MKFTKSFYDWCVENNRQDLLDRWDYDLNKKSPNERPFNTRVKTYFKCPCGKHSSTGIYLSMRENLVTIILFVSDVIHLGSGVLIIFVMTF